jgi:hypothetical protein
MTTVTWVKCQEIVIPLYSIITSTDSLSSVPAAEAYEFRLFKTAFPKIARAN